MTPRKPKRPKTEAEWWRWLAEQYARNDITHVGLCAAIAHASYPTGHIPSGIKQRMLDRLNAWGKKRPIGSSVFFWPYADPKPRRAFCLRQARLLEKAVLKGTKHG